MSNLLNYVIQEGEVLSDCLPETSQFTSDNSQYFHTGVQEIRSELSEVGDLMCISYEKNWTLMTVIEKSELGRISKGKGVMVDGAKCAYDEILKSTNFNK